MQKQHTMIQVYMKACFSKTGQFKTETKTITK